MNNKNQKTSMDNHILNNWDPTSWGFDRERSRSENTVHTYYKLEITEIMSIHISASQYPEAPHEIVEQAVEVSICDNYELLWNITSKQRMATLIRSLSGRSYKYFANLSNPDINEN